MFTGLVVGVLLLLISVFMIFQTTCKVWGSQITPTQAEKNGLENSFRYTDGKLKSTTERMTRSLTRVVKPSNATAQGIDVSYHQGTIDWEKVKNSGQVDFAIIRCGIGMDQTNQDDTQWENNTSECERLGIPYGTFLYSYADTVEKARSEAQHVIRLVQLPWQPPTREQKQQPFLLFFLPPDGKSSLPYTLRKQIHPAIIRLK